MNTYTDLTITLNEPVDKLLMQELYLWLCREFKTANISFRRDTLFVGKNYSLTSRSDVHAFGIIVAQRCAERATFDMKATVRHGGEDGRGDEVYTSHFDGEQLKTESAA